MACPTAMSGTDSRRDSAIGLSLQSVAAMLFLVCLLLRPVVAADVKGEAATWKALGRDANSQYFSPLDQINLANVSKLRLKWYVDVDTKGGLLGNPLVDDGVIYDGGVRGVIWAHDLKSGRLLWTYTPKLNFSGGLAQAMAGTGSRGLGLGDKNVYVGTPDCRLLAVDRKSGSLAWEAKVCEANESLTVSAPPRVGGGKVFVGTANMDLGVGRAHVDAFDEVSGRHVWRFDVIPGDPAKRNDAPLMAKAAKTWGSNWWKWAAGGSVWDAITYDPQLHLLYFGTGNSQPMNPNGRGDHRGAELFTSCVVAVSADTGKYVWHYQTTPNDAWDYEGAMHIVVADLPVNGRNQRVIMTAPKNGFFYVLNARTGHFVSAKNFVPVTWASRIDPKTGEPTEIAAARYYEQPGKAVTVAPSIWGAHNWHPMSFNPVLQLVYVPATRLSMTLEMRARSDALSGNVHLDWSDALRDARARGDAGELIAWNPVSQSAVWTQRSSSGINGGVLSTRGGLVFQGTGDGQFFAYDAKTGHRLWRVDVGSSVQAAPSSVMAGDEQVILLPVGLGGGIAHIEPNLLGNPSYGPSRLLAYSLDGTAELPAVPAEPPFPKPPQERPRARDLVTTGRQLFAERGCGDCHGPDAMRHAGADVVPDLRRLSAATLLEFPGIVLGSRRDRGMPVFAGQVTPSDINALQAFVLDQAWNAYESQEAGLQASPTTH
jgi:PQQ-dependent dehydrogenase (methanol/ethanol family)